MLQRKSTKYYIFLRAIVCTRMRVRARERRDVRVRACALVALLIQRATPLRHVVSSTVDSLAPPHFSILSHKRRNYRKMLLNIKCVFQFSLQRFEIFLILSRIQSDIIVNV